MDNNIKTTIEETLECKVGDSCYITTEEGENWLSNNSDNVFNFIHLNVRGLFGKKDNLKDLIAEIEGDDESNVIHSIGICETLLSHNIPTENIGISNYEIIRSDRKTKKGGGVAILIKKNLNYKQIEVESIDNIFETVALEVKINSKEKILLLEIYRAPNTNTENFINYFSSLIKRMSQKYKRILVGSDTNINHLKSDIHQPTSKFINEILENGLSPTIFLPT